MSVDSTLKGVLYGIGILAFGALLAAQTLPRGLGVFASICAGAVLLAACAAIIDLKMKRKI